MEAYEAVVDVVVAPFPEEACTAAALILARDLRELGISCVVDSRSVRLKNKLQKAADLLRPYFVVIIGPDDLTKGELPVRDLDEKAQMVLPLPVRQVARRLAIEIWTEPVIRLREALLGSGPKAAALIG